DYSGRTTTGPITGNVIADDTGDGVDSDVDASDMLSVGQVNGDAANVGASVTLASGATVVVGADGSMSVDPSTSNVAIDGTLTDTFTYTVSDGNGGTDTATVSIVIRGELANDPPLATDNTAAVSEDNVLSDSGNLLTDDDGFGVDSDVDGGVLAVAGVDAETDPASDVAGVYGTLDWNADGSYTYTLDNASLAVQSLGEGEVVTDTFTYTLSDSQGGTATASLTVAITGANDAPIASDNAYSTDEDSIATGDVIGDDTGAGPDSDVDANDTLAVTHVNGDAIQSGVEFALPSGALLTINADGTFEYDPNGLFNGLAANESFTDTFTYTVSDGSAADTATVAVTLEGQNDPPHATDNDYTAVDGIDLTGDVLNDDSGAGLDSDPDGDPLTVTQVNGDPANVGTTVVLPSGALLLLNADGSFMYNSTVIGGDSFTYTIDDGNGGTDTATVTINVEQRPNNEPTAMDDMAMIDQGQIAFIDVLANDVDPDGDPLRVNGVSQGANGSVGASNGVVTYRPDPGFLGTDTFTYSITDDRGGMSTALVTVVVKTPNLPPVANDDTRTTTQDVPLTILPMRNDTDPNGDVLVITRVDDPANGTVSNLVDDRFLYTPDPGFLGTDTFEYEISDGRGGADTATIRVRVLEPNGAPIAADDSDSTIENTPIVIDVKANDSDPDGDPITVIDVTDGTNGSVSITSGNNVRYSPDPGFVGTDTFTYTIEDDAGHTAVGNVTVVVRPEPRVDLSVTKTDGERRVRPGDQLTYTIVVSNAGPGDALGATVTDLLPAELLNVSWTSVASGGATSTPGPVNGDLIDVIDLPAGSSIVYTVHGIVNPGAIGVIANTVTVEAATGFNDVNPDNNSDTDETSVRFGTGQTSFEFVHDGENTYFQVVGTNDHDRFELWTDAEGRTNVSIIIGPGPGLSISRIVSPGAIAAAEEVFGLPYGGVLVKGLKGHDMVDARRLTMDHARLEGDQGDDLLIGGDLDDHLEGNRGDDVLIGGPGNDVLLGGLGNDTLRGNTGDDRQVGGDGDDEVIADVHDSTLNGGDGQDRIDFSNSSQGEGFVVHDRTLYGVAYENTTFESVVGTPWGDLIDNSRYRGNVPLRVFARNGDDVIIASATADIIDGQGGSDFVSYEASVAGVTVDLDLTIQPSTGGYADGDELRNIENIKGSAHDDVLSGNSDANILKGMDGDDTLNGRGGSDVLLGGIGNDILLGGTGNDMLDGEFGRDIINGQNGVDRIVNDLAEIRSGQTDLELFSGSERDFFEYHGVRPGGVFDRNLAAEIDQFLEDLADNGASDFDKDDDIRAYFE
ncbi:MAG: tandem-95 repeat protein, partial [Planctomycetales bacterium]|nr:tandem-95 repeat protein [Planctomycetales bacterium]